MIASVAEEITSPRWPFSPLSNLEYTASALDLTSFNKVISVAVVDVSTIRVDSGYKKNLFITNVGIDRHLWDQERCQRIID